MRTVEILVAYQDGVWDTDYIEIPDDLMDLYNQGLDITNGLADIYNKHLDSLEPQVRAGLPDIALIALYNIEVE